MCSAKKEKGHTQMSPKQLNFLNFSKNPSPPPIPLFRSPPLHPLSLKPSD